MDLQRFFSELADALKPASDSDSAHSLSPPLRVIYDPARDISVAAEILIGVGAWGDAAQPAQHEGICLNNKGTAGRFGRAQDYATVTDLVLDPPAELEAHWHECAADHPDLSALLKSVTLVAEDAGPDSCLAFLCWLARQRGVAVVELRAATMAPWLRAVRRWETSGMVSEPYRGAWPLLLSALGHSHFFVTDSAKSADALSEELSQAWVEGLAFTVALLQQGIDPNAVPALWDVPGYRRAISFLDGEYQDYVHSLEHATTLQLYVPLWGSDDRRGLLVDAYFAIETWPSGAKKIFVRTDPTHTYLKQGFTVMGLYRPDERLRGSGNDMTVSVNPETGIYLRHLWEELERIETERWEGRRPRGQPRPIASYPPGEGYDQPWWDDFGRYTLLGAPKSVADGQPGSRLNWADVVDAAWRCYQPLKDLRVNDGLNGGAPCLVHECRQQSFRFDAEAFAITKRLMAVQWRSDTERPSSLLGTPSAKRYLAALLARGAERTTHWRA